MTAEDDELLARIGRLAGQINQHKNQTPDASHHGGHHAASHGAQRHPRHHAGWTPYRGRGRPYRRGVGQHRHRTLVLNNNSQGTNSDAASATPPTDSNDEGAADVKPAQQGGWIAKRDRHMQLINTSIFDQEAQARTKAMEESRKLKTQKRAEREQAKVMRHAQFVGRAGTGHENVPPTTSHQIVVHGVPFRVAKGGSKLIRMSSDPTTANTTPKKVSVGGVSFVRSKKGNLHRLGAVVSKKKPRVVKKKDLCKRFTATGSCHKGPNCPYVHDPAKVAICKSFLQTGECPAGEACDLSHTPCPERSPVCIHFIRGRCTNPSCRYSHVRVTPGAPVCRDFAILGYCSKGDRCEERHVHECPDHANTGKCNNKRCQLPHIDRAGQIRNREANMTGSADNNNSTEEEDDDEDVSSEEEYDEIDSDDVDSDELDETEEFIQGSDHGEIEQQQDFIPF